MNIDGEVVHCPHADHTPLCRCASDRRVIDERVYFAERDADARSNRVHGRIMAMFVLALFALAAWPIIRDAIRDAPSGGDLPQRGAICRDGWVSHSTGQGTCSHHLGVRRWIVNHTEVCNSLDLANRLASASRGVPIPPENADCTPAPAHMRDT